MFGKKMEDKELVETLIKVFQLGSDTAIKSYQAGVKSTLEALARDGRIAPNLPEMQVLDEAVNLVDEWDEELDEEEEGTLSDILMARSEAAAEAMGAAEVEKIAREIGENA